MDRDNLNPQNKNAQMILGHLRTTGLEFLTFTYNAPDQLVEDNESVHIVRLWRSRAYRLHLFLRYLRDYDLIFYPGVDSADIWGLRLRRRLFRTVPVVAVLEGLLGNQSREQEYSGWAGHPVFCQQVAGKVLEYADELYRSADRIVAISPFLAQMGTRRFGDKFLVLPLGIDSTVFYPPASRNNPRPRVVSAGRVESHKRPEVFFKMAESHPQADFIWFGEGSLRESLNTQARSLGLENIGFPGPLPPAQLASAFRSADIFVMPSMSEGVPKVTQEAAACGLPVVLFGFYEAPSVVDGINGCVVWNDEALMAQTALLLASVATREEMGRRGAKMAEDYSWKQVVPLWQRAFHDILPTR